MSSMQRLLIVDDEKLHLEALCTLLLDAGYEVTGCEDPNQAMRVLREQSFDLLLSDLQMPDMDGVELARQAAAVDPDLVAVLMTGHASLDSAVEAMKAGVLDYIYKPFRMSEIMPVVLRALEVRRLRVENRALLKKVTDANTQLEAANKELDNFAARIAHDLRSFMHVIQGFAGLLSRISAERLNDKERSYLKRIIDASARGGLLIDDLLVFARLGTRPIESAPVALTEVFEKARHMLGETVKQRQVEWDVGCLPTLPGNASLLQQVFANLLSNALKYSRNREVSRIQVEAQASDKGYEISIRDNGVGFDPAYADRLFQPFERLHRADEFEGNGMGLVNVQRIIECHGGTVRAQSWPGEGALFAFTLPVQTL